MANLLGENIGLNYKGFLNIGSTINTPLNGTLQSITDGDGIASPLQLSTTTVNINGLLSLNGNLQSLINQLWQLPNVARATGTNTDSLLSLSYAINNTGGTNTVTGLKINATETAIVGTTHSLMDLQIGGVSKFKVSNGGRVDSELFYAQAALYTVASGSIVIDNRMILSSSSNGVVKIADISNISFNRLQFGGTTNAFPSIKRNGANIDFKFADDSAFCAINSNNINSGGATLNSARLAVRGDGTNSIARFENTLGQNGWYFTASGSSLNADSQARMQGAAIANDSSVILGSYNALTTTNGTQIIATIQGSIICAIGSGNKRIFANEYSINNSGAQTGNATGIFLNATETALNGMTHNLIDLQVGGASKFKVTNLGGIVIDRSVGLTFDLSSKIVANSNGQITMTDSTATTFIRLNLGGTTSAFPSIKRNGTGIDFRLADDSNYCKIITGDLQMASNTTFESLGNTVNLRSNLGGGSGYILDVQSRNALSGSNVEQGAITINVSKANSATGSANFRPISLTYTINNTAAQTGNATGIYLNATETAMNGMSHNLMDLQVGGSTRFRVEPNGVVSTVSIFFASNGLVSGDSGKFGFNTRSNIYSPSDGVLRLANQLGTDFNRLQLGGTTNAFPSIKRNGSQIDLRLADDSGYCQLNSGDIFINKTNATLQLSTGSDQYLRLFGGNGGIQKITSTYKLELTASNGTDTLGLVGSSIGVSNVAITNHTSAILQVDSTTKGFLMPRMTYAQMKAIATPATGLQVYNTDNKTPQVYDGTGYQILGTSVVNGTISAGATTLSCDAGNIFALTLVNGTPTAITLNNARPTSVIINLKQPALGSATVTWATTIVWAGGSAPTLTTTANYLDVITLIYDGTTWRGTATLNFSA